MKKLTLFSFFILALFLGGCANQLSFKKLNSIIPFNYEVVPFQYFATTDNSLSIKDILTPEYQSKFDSLQSTIPMDRSSFYWLKIDLSNVKANKNNDWYIESGNFTVNNTFYNVDDSIAVSKNGVFSPVTKKYESIYWRYQILSSANLIDGKYIYAQLHSNYFNNLLFNDLVRVFEEGDFNNYAISIDLALSEYRFRSILFLGGIAFLLIYTFGIYFVYKDGLYLLYGAYLFFALMYLGVKLYPMQSTFLFGNYPLYNHIWNEITQILLNFWYIRFVRRFIDAKNLYPTFNKAAKILEWIVLSFAVVAFLNMLISPLSSFLYYIVMGERVTMIVIAVTLNTYLLINRKDRRPLFIVVGSLMLLTGSLTSLIMGDVQYFMIGMVIEIFIFSMGLGFLMRKREDEKALLNKEMEKVKLRALQTQMNPHFIFNSLNSIRAYMIKNETIAASGYLSKFSRLIRQILEYSSEEYITLKQELKALSLYVHIEQLRFRDEFGFNIIIPDEIDQEEYMVPPLIMQPFLENAIWHGLMQKQGEKELELIVENNASFLKVTVRDNGIGRVEASKNNSHIPKENKSMAIDLTTRRLQMLHKNKSDNRQQIIINDLYHEDNTPKGTEVILLLPKIMRKHS